MNHFLLNLNSNKDTNNKNINKTNFDFDTDTDWERRENLHLKGSLKQGCSSIGTRKIIEMGVCLIYNRREFQREYAIICSMTRFLLSMFITSSAPSVGSHFVVQF